MRTSSAIVPLPRGAEGWEIVTVVMVLSSMVGFSHLDERRHLRDTEMLLIIAANAMETKELGEWKRVFTGSGVRGGLIKMAE